MWSGELRVWSRVEMYGNLRMKRTGFVSEFTDMNRKCFEHVLPTMIRFSDLRFRWCRNIRVLLVWLMRTPLPFLRLAAYAWQVDFKWLLFWTDGRGKSSYISFPNLLVRWYVSRFCLLMTEVETTVSALFVCHGVDLSRVQNGFWFTVDNFDSPVFRVRGTNHDSIIHRWSFSLICTCLR